MNMGLYIAIGIVAYLVCSIICIGFVYAHFCGKYPTLNKNEHFRDSLVLGFMGRLIGPIGIIEVYLLSERGKYGWRLR